MRAGEAVPAALIADTSQRGPATGGESPEASEGPPWVLEEMTPSAARAFRHARRAFLAGERLDMTELAAQLNINRVTLYRWVGRREGLIVRILWTLSVITLQHAIEDLPIGQLGRQRTPEVLSRFVLDSLSTRGTRVLLQNEGDLALRVLTTARYGYQPRLQRAIEDLLQDDVANGHRAPEEPLSDLAFAAVRLIEAYIHLNRITGEEPDAQRARAVLHVLLR